MQAHVLKSTQRFPVDIKTLWDFLSVPANLEKITPPYIHIKVSSDDGTDKAYPGKILNIKMTPILGIPLTWTSEITHLQEYSYFVDEMRQGPLAFWHHQHHIVQIPGGVEMQDILHYKLPLGFIGRIGNFLLVNKQMKNMFNYRERVLEQLFGKL